jgi:hypothetical protein
VSREICLASISFYIYIKKKQHVLLGGRARRHDTAGHARETNTVENRRKEFRSRVGGSEGKIGEADEAQRAARGNIHDAREK